MADKDRSKSIIDNDSFRDSADVYNQIFKSCSETVFILARGIKDQIFNHENVKDSAIEFLSKENAKIHMILRAKDEADVEKAINSPFICALSTEIPPAQKLQIDFYKGGNEWLNDVGSTTIGDERIYRHRYFQSHYNHANAHVCFNGVNKCKEHKEKISLVLQDSTAFESYTH